MDHPPSGQQEPTIPIVTAPDDDDVPLVVEGWSDALVCPYCQEPLEEPPTTQRSCARCHQMIVAKQAAGATYLMRQVDEPAFQAALRSAWSGYLMAKMIRDQGSGLLVGERQVGVNGESHYQQALYTVAGSIDPVAGCQKRCVAVLVPEPSNPFNARAIIVGVNGMKVGYVADDETEALEPLMARLAREGRVVAVRATIRGGYKRGGFTTMLGVFLDGLPEQ